MVAANGAKDKTNRIAISTKESTLMIRNQDKAHSHGSLEIFTEVATKMTSVMVTEKCFGLMGQVTKVNGSEAYNTDREL